MLPAAPPHSDNRTRFNPWNRDRQAAQVAEHGRRHLAFVIVHLAGVVVAADNSCYPP
jgi:hypothetical protein